MDSKIKSRHTANAVLKQAGLPKHFYNTFMMTSKNPPIIGDQFLEDLKQSHEQGAEDWGTSKVDRYLHSRFA